MAITTFGEIMSDRNFMVTAAVDPGVDDDNTTGNTIGTGWLNTTTPSTWICIDATTGAAVWRQTS